MQAPCGELRRARLLACVRQTNGRPLPRDWQRTPKETCPATGTKKPAYGSETVVKETRLSLTVTKRFPCHGRLAAKFVLGVRVCTCVNSRHSLSVRGCPLTS